MKIIGGQFKGRRLNAPNGRFLRPTSDKVREAIFNILVHSSKGFNFTGIKVLDLFCGTGALGIEALSRGASHVTFVDNNQNSLNLARKNLEALDFFEYAKLIKVDLKSSSPLPFRNFFDLVFLDAPYDCGLTLTALEKLRGFERFSKKAKIVAEISKKEEIIIPDFFKLVQMRTYGKTKVLFLEYE